MSAGLQAIGLFAPIVASNAIFSARRASKGVNSIDENPIYGAMNMDIAAGQTLKGFKAAKEVAAVSNSEAHIMAEGASEAIKNLSKANKLVSGIGKVVDFTSNNINPIICATSAAKVLFGSDDKFDAGAREIISLGTMFASERAAKTFLGMPYTTKEGGEVVTHLRESLYNKNPFLKEQASALKDYCATKKLFNKISLNFVPGAAKGLAFVGASIAGYKLGSLVADCLLGSKDSEEPQETQERA